MPKLKSLKKEIKKYPLVYLLLFVILILGLFLRVYRVDQVLGFYFDQGRDALVIWDFWHNGKLFLVGPTTGIAGIFRGPLYYYLIAPFYLLGGGDPIWPSIFLAITSVMAIGLMYYLGKIIHSRVAGIIAAFIASFSFYIIFASRWLSNPTPMLLLSMLLVWMMILITEGKKFAWYLLVLIAGISLFHFGSSGEFFYLPALVIFAIWQKKTLTKKIILICGFLFFLTASPLVLFDMRHQGILLNNIKKFLFEEGSFKSNFWDVLPFRLNFFYESFSNKIFHWRRSHEIAILIITGISYIFFLPKLLKSNGVRILMLLLLSPIVGLLFFQGNFGNIYDYYLTGYYLVFILLFSIVLGQLWQKNLGKIFILIFISAFLKINLDVTWYRISDQLTGPESIGFGNQKQAIDWIYQDARGEQFSADVYVPPVIPYAYDYLFLWYGGQIIGYALSAERISPLYTLYESDSTHQDKLDAWLARQKGIGVVEKQAKFGGITVQRRKRL